MADAPVITEFAGDAVAAAIAAGVDAYWLRDLYFDGSFRLDAEVGWLFTGRVCGASGVWNQVSDLCFPSPVNAAIDSIAIYVESASPRSSASANMW